MIRYDESEFEARTDNPCYQDDNITIKCNWQDEDAYPFGYWDKHLKTKGITLLHLELIGTKMYMHQSKENMVL